ncbi:oligosaccharide repeat unit polymerase [Vibrio vulnificus]|nr:oligosaccharide repeat unit polymerase [Vibrio vulnificus]EKO5196827.1 oligosaccharide repeat unit polymerase [Vibrio vulnificus]
MFFFNINTKGLFYTSLFIFMLIEISDFVIPFGASGDIDGFVLYYIIMFSYLASLFISSFYTKVIHCSLPNDIILNRILNKLFYISIIGFMLVIFDRIFIQQIDYSQGVALAREAWREQAKERSGASSVFNVIGNLIFPMFYVVFFFLVSFYERVTKNNRKNLKWTVIFILLFSALTGGREPVLVFLSILTSAMIFRRSSGLNLLPQKIRFVTIFLCIAVIVFSIVIGLIRTQVYSFSLYEYGVSLSGRLGGRVTSDFNNLAPDFLFPVLIYLAHTKWIFINILTETQTLEGLSTFRQIWMMFHQYLPFIFTEYDSLPPLYTPNWISLIGSIYYDFGLLLAIFIFLIPWVFILFMHSVFVMKMLNLSLVSFVFYACFSSIICFSIFSFLFETVQFIYIFFSVPILFFFHCIERAKYNNE